MAIKELAVSSGFGCTSASLEPSYVLRALGPATTSWRTAPSALPWAASRPEQEIDFTIELIKSRVGKLRDMSPLWEMAPGRH
ncbi:hypothetical protein PV012_20010 [Bordetella pertussis]|uniref:hypothetical protein n=1 Tax=Bordetella pertussis TaxID=520 RepID=UPI0028EFCE2A|nr:hypothetical protein [Bordetella pertussis]WNR27554.1 hypothetical protein PV012_20010 [Bordetella pertussis]